MKGSRQATTSVNMLDYAVENSLSVHHEIFFHTAKNGFCAREDYIHSHPPWTTHKGCSLSKAKLHG
jgi:hypothetical protein